jgi:hypothetical protein
LATATLQDSSKPEAPTGSNATPYELESTGWPGRLARTVDVWCA